MNAYQDEAEPARQLLKTLVTAEGTRRLSSPAEIQERLLQFGSDVPEEQIMVGLRRLVNDRIVREDAYRHLFELRHDALAAHIRQWMSGIEQELVEARQTLEYRLREYRQSGRLLDSDFLAYLAPYETHLHLRGEFAELVTKSRQQELARKEAMRKASLRRWRQVAAGFAALSVLLGGGLFYYVYYLYDRVWEHPAYYNTYIKKRGIAEGYGKLTDAQRQARAVSLRVVREGGSGPVLSIEAVDANENCTPKHSIGTLLEFKASDTPAYRECRWEFVRDSDGDIAYEMAYNQFNNLVWALAYTPKTPALGGKRRAYFVNAQGLVAPLKNSRADIIEFAYTQEGYEKQHSYFGRDGSAQPGIELAYSQRISHTSDGFVTEVSRWIGTETR